MIQKWQYSHDVKIVRYKKMKLTTIRIVMSDDKKENKTPVIYVYHAGTTCQIWFQVIFLEGFTAESLLYSQEYDHHFEEKKDLYRFFRILIPLAKLSLALFAKNLPIPHCF